MVWVFGTGFFVLRALAILVFDWKPVSGFVRALFP